MREALRKLKQIRAGHKAAVTRSINKAEALLVGYDVSRESEINAICSFLLEKSEKIKSLDEEILVGFVD